VNEGEWDFGTRIERRADNQTVGQQENSKVKITIYTEFMTLPRWYENKML
jgi:hypothetical protein